MQSSEHTNSEGSSTPCSESSDAESEATEEPKASECVESSAAATTAQTSTPNPDKQHTAAQEEVLLLQCCGYSILYC